MSSRHPSSVRLALEDQTVAALEGARRSEQPGRLTVREEPGDGDTVATLALAADPVAARERGVEIDLTAAEAAELESVLASAREDA